MNDRPHPDSQEGRILQLLKSAAGRKVPLPAILDLRPRISQYGRAIHTLRHRYGFLIENGLEQDRSDHTWFRLIGRSHDPMTLDSADRQAKVTASKHVSPRAARALPSPKMGPVGENPMLFPEAELQRTARWEDCG